MSQISMEELYVAYFGRAADPAGLNNWLTQEAEGTSGATIALQFVPQLETLGLYPLLNTPTLLAANAVHDFLAMTPSRCHILYRTDRLESPCVPGPSRRPAGIFAT
jgi:hypothetical protein